MSILIIDDSYIDLVLLTNMLEKAGYGDTYAFESGQEALHFLGLDKVTRRRQRKLDLILMDIVMPGMDGISFCRLINGHSYYKDIPIIMVTSSDDVDVLHQAFDVGAVDWIIKPVREIELLARVRSFLKLKKEMDRRKKRERELVKVTRQLEKANETLQQFSYIDGLTSAYNRRYFDELLEKEWRRAMRRSDPLALIMADIDFFKAYNDSYGHQAGDDALRKISMALKYAARRSGDFVARYGGEEFIVVLPNTNIAGASTVADTMKSNVDMLAISHKSSTVNKHLTVSMGVAVVVPKRDSSPADLLAAVDKALYLAKKNGRNRIVGAP